MANSKSNTLWELVKEIWDKGDNRKDFVKKCNDYWDGNLHANFRVYDDQEKTAFNIVKPMVETKLKAVLDTQFTLAVVPQVNSFSALSTLKEHQAVADIYNDELNNILDKNKLESKNEVVGRAGMNCGFGILQTLWDTDEDERGDIKISYIPSENLKWDKEATSIEDSSFVGYSFTLNPAEAKDKYCRDEEGNFDEKKCLQIDKVAISQTKKREDKRIKGVVSGESDVGGGQAYTYDLNKDGIVAGKKVDLICVFLIDDTIYAPDKDDSNEEKIVKEESIAKYPNGRMIIFSPNEKEKLILKDVAVPKSFRNLGNIDIFNPIYWKGIPGKGEVENLFATQDRVDGLYNKYRDELRNNIDAIVVEKNALGDDDWVEHPVWFQKPGTMKPEYVTNGGMDNATKALKMIEQLENHAAKMGRVNETMLYGHRQTGTNSGEQVEMLQESPLADIRGITRNYRDFLISVGNKCIQFIQHNYTVDRLIKLSTGMSEGAYAKLQLNMEGEKELVTLNEAGDAIKTIKVNPEWEFQVEVCAGTDVPRSRREQAQLMNSLVDRDLLDMSDPDMVEQYLRSLDVPNYRLLIKILREKQAQAQQTKNSPEATNWKEMMRNPDIAKEFANNFKALVGYPKAQQQMLKEVGLVPDPGKLDTMPVNEITRESDVAEVMTLVPDQISEEPQKIVKGRDAAVAGQLIDTIK